MSKKLKWYHGLIALVLFGGILALEYFGLLGRSMGASVIGELLFAVVAVGVCLLARSDWRKVFPFKKMHLIQLAGIYLMWRGVMAVELLLAEVCLYLDPELFRDQSGLDQWIMHTPFFLALLVVAVMPAVCEEILFRGTILRSMERIKWPWLIIVLNGLIFGVAHASPIKMVSVSLLGILLAYVTYTSGNLGYSILLHFVNNGWSVVCTYILMGLSKVAGQNIPESVGQAGLDRIPLGSIALMIWAAAFAPILIYVGHNLFLRQPGNAKLPPDQRVTLRKEWLILTAALAFLIFSLGTLVFAHGFEELYELGMRSIGFF